jgi:hypothetical protein
MNKEQIKEVLNESPLSGLKRVKNLRLTFPSQ